MNFESYYTEHLTYITHLDTRLKKIISIVKDLKPKKVLDIGCGSGFLLEHLINELPKTQFTGIDVYKKPQKLQIAYKRGDITEGLPFKNNEFDCVVLGEVIEHVPNPDFVLREIRRILKADGVLIISTPNLVSWMNRILVLCGVQPLFTETSSEITLGRFYKLLGQGNPVQGHLKIFTYKSLQEILEKEKFEIQNRFGVPFFFPFPISLLDRLFTKFIPLTSGLLYTATKAKKR